MALSFDPASKRIVLDRTSISAAEIYSRWCDWVVLSDNLKHAPAFRTTGGDDLGDGLLIPGYYFLANGWRVRPMEANHTLVITGNLFVDGGGVPVVNVLGNFQVNVNYTVPVQAQAVATGGGSGGITPTDRAEIAAAVLEALSLQPIPADVQRVRGQNIEGVGAYVWQRVA